MENKFHHLFEVQQLLCTNVACTGNVYSGVNLLGLPAQKGWEFCSPLSGSHHPRLSEKFVADSVFINAFVNRLLNLPYFTTQEQFCQYQECTKIPLCTWWLFSSVHKCAYREYKSIPTFLKCPSVSQIRFREFWKPTFVFFQRTKILDRNTLWCYHLDKSSICQMRLSRKSSRNDGFRELPGGARQ